MSTKSTFIVIAAFAAGACSKADEPLTRDSARGSDPRPAAATLVEFDPSATQRGDMIHGLTVDSIAAKATPKGEVIGMARFSGALVLSGQTFRHPDGNDYAFPCFEADSVSARKLPRWAGDTRRPWFCFENRDEAKQQLGGPSAGIPVTIRVHRFTIHKNLSDAVNSAYLLEVVSRGDSANTARAVCYSTSRSVLGRAPGTAAPAPRGVKGWVQLDGLSATTDSGAARLVDSDGRSLAAAWRRVGTDSLGVVGFDDFMRVEMRLRATPDRISGSAVMTSDAATSRDSAGRSTSLNRKWTVDGASQTCGSMPAAGTT